MTKWRGSLHFLLYSLEVVIIKIIWRSKCWNISWKFIPLLCQLWNFYRLRFRGTQQGNLLEFITDCIKQTANKRWENAKFVECKNTSMRSQLVLIVPYFLNYTPRRLFQTWLRGSGVFLNGAVCLSKMFIKQGFLIIICDMNVSCHHTFSILHLK